MTAPLYLNALLRHSVHLSDGQRLLVRNWRGLDGSIYLFWVENGRHYSIMKLYDPQIDSKEHGENLAFWKFYETNLSTTLPMVLIMIGLIIFAITVTNLCNGATARSYHHLLLLMRLTQF